MITLKNKKTKINIIDPRGKKIENAKYSDIIEYGKDMMVLRG